MENFMTEPNKPKTNVTQPSHMNLDKFLNSREAAEWLGITQPVLVNKKIKGRNPEIPAFCIGNKSYRYHPRTIITKLAKDAGVPFDVIVASLGESKDDNQLKTTTNPSTSLKW